MLTNQQDLYNNLMALTTNEAFYHIDQTLDGFEYRIFNYRLASYTDFCAPNALEMRGIMFEMKDGQPVQLVCRPPAKFFNYRENPFTANVNFNLTNSIMDKADGSLISTYMQNGKVKLKSKASLASEQAQASQKILEADDEFYSAVERFVKDGYTVNMEYVAPSNRIVLAYDRPQLIVLNIRDNDTGQYLSPDLVKAYAAMDKNHYAIILKHWVKMVSIGETILKYGSVQAFVDAIDTHEGIEGFVIGVGGMYVKLKCIWYLTRHRAKDSINSTRRLFEAVLEEAIDDVRVLFFDDPVAIARINEVQEKTDKIYNHLVATIEAFYAANKELDRKEYAILGQQTFTDGTFGLAMNKYLGKDAGYKEFLKKNYKRYGFTDDAQNVE